MFVTAIASVSTVVVSDMAGDTAGIMITLQHKNGLVIKTSWNPVFLGVALSAIAVNVLMQRIGRWLVAILTLTTRFYF
jgi:putative Ca2+/H+ antiporter (TMEM165/GDT1 family)